MTAPALTVHVRVNDAATGRPTPVRLRITGPGGELYAPFGRVAEFAFGRNEDVGGHLLLGRERFVYIDGTCEIKLPTAAPLRFEISKGPEYVPIREEVTLGVGQMSRRFAISRWADFRAKGWYSGDTRCHFLTPHAALLEAAAEDLAVVNLLATLQMIPSGDGRLYPSIPDMLAFSGQRPLLEMPGHLVAVNTLNAHPAIGRVGLLHCHRAVYPLTFGGAEDTDDWSLCDWCDQCHRKNGLVTWVDAFRSEAGLSGGEALVALILGKVDAIEADAFERTQPLWQLWYRLLNAGFRVPLVGGSGKDSNRIALGGVRTCAHIPPETPFSYGAWIEAVRAGRVFASNGPLIEFTANGQFPGATLSGSPDEPVRVEASASSLAPFERLEIVANGEVVGQASASADGTTARIELEHRLPEGGWLAARCWGGQRPALYPHGLVFAHTSPVYVRPTGRPPYRNPAALPSLLRAAEQTRDWVETEGRFANPRSKEHLLALCREAMKNLTSEAPSG